MELIFLVDADDETRSLYPGTVIVGTPTGDPTGPLNSAVKASTSEIVGFLGDDSRFATAGWDKRVLDAMKTPSICYGWDGHQTAWPTTVFISKSITDALGYMVPPTLRRGFFDVAWMNLAKATDTARILDDVVFPHDNSAGDPTSKNFKPEAQVPPEVIASDERAYNFWFAHDFKKDARLVTHAIYR